MINKVFFSGALSKSTGTGDFEFFRKISCTRDISFSLYWKTLSFYDKFPVLGIFHFPCTGRLWVFTINSRYWGFFIFPSTGDFEFEQKIPCAGISPPYWRLWVWMKKILYWDFPPLLETLILNEKSVYWDFALCWRLWVWTKKMPVLGFSLVLETLSLNEKIPVPGFSWYWRL